MLFLHIRIFREGIKLIFMYIPSERRYEQFTDRKAQNRVFQPVSVRIRIRVFWLVPDSGSFLEKVQFGSVFDKKVQFQIRIRPEYPEFKSL